MKHATWLAGLLVLSVGAAQAAAPDGLDAQTAPSVASAPQAPAPTLASDLSAQRVEPHRQALTTLHAERQAFVQAFDWSGDRVIRGREFQAAMERFDLRELELKRDWYTTSGQSDLLARTEEALAKRTAPVQTQPDLGLERPAPAAQTQEEGR
jgi:hypothetical protein